MPQDNETVEVHYHGTLDNGEVFDSSREREPFSFVVGSGQVLAGFDRAVRKLALGETITVRLEPLEAYGERRDDYVLELPIDQLLKASIQGITWFLKTAFPVLSRWLQRIRSLWTLTTRLAGHALTFEIELVSIKWQ